jgi:pullulanase
MDDFKENYDRMKKTAQRRGSIFSNANVFLYSIITLAIFMTTGINVTGQDVDANTIISARISADNIIIIKLGDESITPKHSDFSISPDIKIRSLQKKDGVIHLQTEAIDLSKSYQIQYKKSRKELQPNGVLDELYSYKELGCTWNDECTIFRVFAPRATKVSMLLFDSLDTDAGSVHLMDRDADGVWECLLPGQYFGKYYNYKVEGSQSPTELFDDSKLICDPYSKVVATRNEYLHRGKTLIMDTGNYDWEGDSWLKYSWEDLIIYECHVRDMTAHSSSGAAPELAGSYRALIQQGIRGGIEHIKSLGVNAVEFLPIHEFGNIELPYGVRAEGQTNAWNPYARNHWGYMTSYYFAPESYYASGGNLQPNHYSGADGRQAFEFKDLVKAFHREGIAVILDVVYNHVANYDQNCFKLLDKKYYFRLDDNQNFIAASGCGNDFMTERAMVQKLIVESVKYWMTEYHVDGFRFDLAAMIDWDTVDKILTEARLINPEVIIIAEPWGGGKYEPVKFSSHGWAAWNDQFRNGIKGQNPITGQSFIFGRWWELENMKSMQRYVCGNLASDGGLFVHRSQAVNYLESHDDHTLGDFIRIGNGDIKPDQVIADPLKNAQLTERQMKINMLGALLLFTSQGAVMIGEGQEFARSKVIAPTTVPEPRVGQIDHNSYNKDDETNWLDYRHADLNKALVDYYKGLIALRKSHPAFRHSAKRDITFLRNDNPFALSYLVTRESSGDKNDFLVLVNANRETAAQFVLPEGNWSIVVDGVKAGTERLRKVTESTITLAPTSGMVLMK